METISFKPLDFQSEHPRSKTACNNRMPSRVLGDIPEEEEWCTTESRSIAMTPAPVVAKRKFMKKHCSIFNQPLNYSADPQVADFQMFLIKLQKNYPAYEAFLKAAETKKLIKLKECKAVEYYYRYIHFANNSKLQVTTKSNTAPHYTPHYARPVSMDQSLSSNISSSSEVFNAYTGEEKSRMLRYIQASRETLIRSERKPRPRSRKKKIIVPRRVILSRTSPKLIKIFQTMCGSANSALKSCRLTNYLFKSYLCKKFPVEIAENMAKHFDFKSANFEDFCIEMDRFLVGPDEKYFSLCFDAFDFNKDKYLCYQDTYMAIQIRKDNLYDSDLVKIKKMFEMKKQGLSPLRVNESRKGRRMSVLSLTSELSLFEDEAKEKEKRIPHIHPDKSEAITFEDFKRIEFKSKPQLLDNFLRFTLHFDIEKFQEVTTPQVKFRKQSQDIIIEMAGNVNSPQNDQDLEKTEYLTELESAMELFPIVEARDLLEKFEILRDKKSPDFKTISKQSMIENWPKLFGVKCDYVSERFYHFFAGPKYVDVTKARFLKMIYSVKSEEVDIKMFSFAMYDQRGDGKITPDEICKMEEALIEQTPMHEECMM